MNAAIVASLLPSTSPGTAISGSPGFTVTPTHVRRSSPKTFLCDVSETIAGSFSSWAASVDGVTVVNYTPTGQDGWTSLARPTFVLEGNIATLDERKRAKVNRIDKRTAELIAAGFEVGGVRFSATTPAQAKWLGIYLAKDSLTYPIVVPNVDDTVFVNVINSDEVVTFYSALSDLVQTVLSSGVALKKQVALASSQEDLDAVNDAR